MTPDGVGKLPLKETKIPPKNTKIKNLVLFERILFVLGAVLIISFNKDNKVFTRYRNS
jgi:hypothetical protein